MFERHSFILPFDAEPRKIIRIPKVSLSPLLPLLLYLHHPLISHVEETARKEVFFAVEAA